LRYGKTRRGSNIRIIVDNLSWAQVGQAESGNFLVYCIFKVPDDYKDRMRLSAGYIGPIADELNK